MIQASRRVLAAKGMPPGLGRDIPKPGVVSCIVKGATAEILMGRINRELFPRSGKEIPGG